MVEATEPDVVCPAVSADDPKALVDEFVRQARQPTSLRSLWSGDGGQQVLQRCHSLALRGDLGVTDLIRTKERTDDLVSDVRPQFLEQAARLGRLLLRR